MKFCGLLVAGVVGVASSHAMGQCTGAFLTGDQVPGVSSPGTVGTVRAALEWDFDGAGPEQSKLIVGGLFANAGGLPAPNLAVWDGSLWSPFGAGANGAVRRLIVHNGQILAAGDFTSIGGIAAPGGLASFDGTVWHAVATPGGAPTQIASVDGVLYASGPFTFNATPGNYVASFDGNAWTKLGGNFDGPINDLTFYQGQLLAAGGFSMAGPDLARCIAAWDGSHWSTFHGGASDVVNCMKVFGAGGTNLYVGGVFTGVGSPVVSASRVAKWNGAGWSSAVSSSVFAEVQAIGGTDTLLVAGGVKPLGSHTLTYATLVGSGMPASSAALTGNFDNDIFWIGSYQGRLHMAGTYQSAATLSGDIKHFSISRVIGEKWHALTGGLNGRIKSLAVHQGQLFGAGDFTRWKDTPVHGIVTWNGTDWVQFNTNFPSSMLEATPELLKSWQNRLYVYGPSANALESFWNGSAWVSWENGVANPLSFVEFVGNRLMCGYIAGWRQATLPPDPYGSAFNSTVWSSIQSGSGYIVGGNFTTANGSPALRVVFSNGSVWTPMGAGFVGTVYKLLSVGGVPHAFGAMSASGATALHGAARWNGTTWEPLGSAPFQTPSVDVRDAVDTSNGIMAVGNFATSDPTLGLMRFDGSNWSSLGGLTAEGIFDIAGGGSIAQLGNELWITGQFSLAGGAPSYQLARYRLGSAPQIAQGPTDAAVNRGEGAGFAVALQEGDSGAAHYQWRHDGAPMGAPISRPSSSAPSPTPTAGCTTAWCRTGAARPRQLPDASPC
ncbi:MAG: hypothetical protein QM783_13020 [Phycisphaerales bacterium]